MANSTVFDPKEAGAPFVAAIFGANGLLVASRAFSSRGEAESFIASGAGELTQDVLLPAGSAQGTRGTYDERSE